MIVKCKNEIGFCEIRKEDRVVKEYKLVNGEYIEYKYIDTLVFTYKNSSVIEYKVDNENILTTVNKGFYIISRYPQTKWKCLYQENGLPKTYSISLVDYTLSAISFIILMNIIYFFTLYVLF